MTVHWDPYLPSSGTARDWTPPERTLYGLRAEPRTYKEVDLTATDYSASEVRSMPAVAMEDANVVISATASGHAHWPAIDLDYPAFLEESSTPGHYHLYLNQPVSKRDYMRVLRTMARAGLIEKGFYLASRARGFSALRLPWVKKKATDEAY